MLYHSTLEGIRPYLDKGEAPPAMESAGPRRMLFFDPAKLACGIVTCGGLCPGLNDVIRAVVRGLRLQYGVNKIYGFRYGYEGLVRRIGHQPLELTPESVHRIHESGGSVLGSSRGPQDAGEMADYLKELGVGILFAIGGDGTLRGAQKIGEEAARRGLQVGVIGIPKTIDNDISFVRRTFGFETAVTEAWRATDAANAEAEAARNGIGLVKLMGRDSGFIAAFSALVNNHVNFCLVPEVPFTLERFLAALQQRLERRGHAVIVVAEGAGQDLMAKSQERDASGNVKYGDIGVFAARRDHGLLQADRHANHPQVHRSQLHHQERAGDGARLGLLPAPRAERGPRGPQRPHEHGRQLLESPLHSCADLARGLRAQEDRPGGCTLEQCGRVDRSAVGHAVMPLSREVPLYFLLGTCYLLIRLVTATSTTADHRNWTN